MTKLVHVDVFTRTRLGGNPLAVFIDPPRLEASEFQAWAREMNLSETIFVWPAATDRYEARIFTPAAELGFAGHPTLGAAHVLRRMGAISGDRATQVTPAGEAVVTYAEDGSVWFSPPAAILGDVIDPAAVGAALGIPTLWISPELPPQAASVGVGHLVVQVQPGHVGSVRPNLARLSDLLEENRLTGLMLWTFAGPGRLHARVFAPGASVPEDPATGSAAAALGVILTQAAGVTDATRYTIWQGAEILRPSEITLVVNHRAVGSIAVGGHVVEVFSADVDMASEGA
jgi:trans-2,3-dihydro-3-hydroxyanthranilate isomerase